MSGSTAHNNVTAAVLGVGTRLLQSTSSYCMTKREEHGVDQLDTIAASIGLPIYLHTE